MHRPSLRRVPQHFQCLRRTYASVSTNLPTQDFKFLPNFLSIPEQRILLTAALQKLDSRENRQFRKLSKEYRRNNPPSSDTPTVGDVFLPDELYSFEEGHYDGVIKRFREMHISSWPDENPGLKDVLHRLQSFHPEVPTQTHLLHLASDGVILPHVDNLGASGAWIMGVSLGATRVLRLESVDNPSEKYEHLLPSGSVYLQRDSIRFGFRHGILHKGELLKASPDGGQRLSVILRDLHPH